MSMTEVVEESLKADARFRHLTVMPVALDELKVLRKIILNKIDSHIRSMEMGND